MSCRVAVGIALTLALAGPASAQSAANLLVVYNASAAGAHDLATAYAAGRGVPDAQVLALRTRAVAETTAAEYLREIEGPIRGWLAANRAQDRILCIVLVKGVPVRIAGTSGRTGSRASVDSELTVLYRRMTGASVPFAGMIPNPYFAGEAAEGVPPRFSHADQDIYLVTRLDGFTAADVRGLIERGRAPVESGRFVLDQRPGFDKANDWLAAAAERLSAKGLGDRVTLERTGMAAPAAKDVLGYFSWGSNDPSLRVRKPDMTFAPGALAGMFLSSDARTFDEPPADWTPAATRGTAIFAGTTQGLTADLVRAGATGAAGQVSEPFLDGTLRPDILFPSYVAGLTLAESFYRAIPYLSWQTVVVGDPLCAPFPRVPISPSELDPPMDPATELPAKFSARRLAVVMGAGGNVAAATALLRGESRAVRKDYAGARQALEQAVAADPNLVEARHALGSVAESLEDYAAVAAIYQQILDRDPKNVIALNNLAYNLAVRQKRPADALPLAERAQLLEPRNALVLDTLGWIRHLLGDDQGALRILIPAARATPDNADVQLHTAVVLAAAGYAREAAQLLAQAEKADAAVVDRPEYQALAEKLRAR